MTRTGTLRVALLLGTSVLGHGVAQAQAVPIPAGPPPSGAEIGNPTPSTEAGAQASPLSGSDPQGTQADVAGVAQIAEQGGKRAIVLLAEGFPRATKQRFYAIWIYKDQTKARRLGFPPQPGKKGQIQTSFAYPDDADEYDRLIITEESSQQPEEPGRIVLTGPLKGTPVSGTATGPAATTTPGG